MKNDKQALVPRLRFPEFRDAGQWQENQLADIATLHKGKGISKADIKVTGSQPCVRYGELYTVYGDVISEVVSKTDVPPDDLFMSREGDVIIPSSGETKIDIATAACVLRENIALGGDLNVIRSEQNGVFLSYYLNGSLKHEIAKVAQGNTVVHLYKSNLEALKLAIPKVQEQQKIADCLSSLDALISAQADKIDTFKTHKKGLMQQLFPREGETVPRLRFPEFRDAGEWRKCKLEELAKRGSGHTPNKKHPSYYNGGIKWVSLADSDKLDNGYIFKTKHEISEAGLRNSSAVLHSPGTVILSRDAGVGKSGVLYSSMAVSQHFIAWSCEKSKLSNWFLYYFLQKMKPTFESIAVGNTIKTIGLTYFKEMIIFVPAVAEQQKIADCLTFLDALIAAHTEKLDALKELKKGLMQKLFPCPEAT